MTTGAPRTARERVRAELTTEITQIARRQLAESGAAALSLRAVARELNMVSSAVYRYFPSRDDLLTRLIIDAYTSLGETVEAAEQGVRRGDLVGRWLALTRATRAWAVERPHEYALIYGSPVPGYRAPQDTIDPAGRLPVLILAVIGAVPPADGPPLKGVSRRLRSDLSATLFLSAPDTYDGGALVAASVAGERSMRLAAGDMLLYPSSSVHGVDPVTRGTRLAAFFWVQSMVRDDAARALLLDLDDTIQDLGTRVRGDDPAIVRLTGTYHNLMRRWADL